TNPIFVGDEAIDELDDARVVTEELAVGAEVDAELDVNIVEYDEVEASMSVLPDTGAASVSAPDIAPMFAGPDHAGVADVTNDTIMDIGAEPVYTDGATTFSPTDACEAEDAK